MAEYSVLFSFTRIDRFFKTMVNDSNITTDLFDGVSKNFRIVLVEACPSNINECLTANGMLDEDKVSTFGGIGENDGLCSLLWEDAVNNNTTISVNDTAITWDFADNSYLLKAAFLVVASTGKVLAYSINNAPVPVKTGMTSPVNGMIWSIVSQFYEE